jgi:DNA polymerase alpha subunit A
VTVAPDGTEIVKRQAKGLDLVRRDWCDLSKVIGKYVLPMSIGTYLIFYSTILDLILSGKPREEIIDGIHQYLRSVREDIEQNKVPIAQYPKAIVHSCIHSISK